MVVFCSAHPRVKSMGFSTCATIWSKISVRPDPAVAFATMLGPAAGQSSSATLIALAVVDQHRRKRMMVAGLFVLAASLLTMALLTVAPQETTVVRWGQVACLAVFVAAFWLTVGPVSGILINEIYPQAIRGRAISLTSG